MDEGNKMIVSTGMAYAPLPEKRSRKKWIIVGVIALVVIAIGVVAVLVIPKLLSPAPKNAGQAFNLYSRYVLYGEKSMDSLSGEYVRTDTYKMDEVLNGSDRESFYKEADGYFRSFMEKYESLADGGGKKVELDAIVENYDELWGFARVYAETVMLTDALVWEKYLAGGESAAREYVSNSYRTLAESENGKIKQYGELKTEQFDALMVALNAYRDGGCIKDGKADDACVNALGQGSEVVRESYNEFYEIRYTTEQMVNANRDDLLRGCWTVGVAVAEVSGG